MTRNYKALIVFGLVAASAGWLLFGLQPRSVTLSDDELVAAIVASRNNEGPFWVAVMDAIGQPGAWQNDPEVLRVASVAAERGWRAAFLLLPMLKSKSEARWMLICEGLERFHDADAGYFAAVAAARMRDSVSPDVAERLWNCVVRGAEPRAVAGGSGALIKLVMDAIAASDVGRRHVRSNLAKCSDATKGSVAAALSGDVSVWFEKLLKE